MAPVLLLHVFEGWAASDVQVEQDVQVLVQNEGDDVEARLRPPTGVVQGGATVVVDDAQVPAVLQNELCGLEI